MLNSAPAVGREVDEPGLPVPRDQLCQAGLIDGDLTCKESVYLRAVDINAYDLVAAIRKAGARDQAHVTGSDYRNLQDDPFIDQSIAAHIAASTRGPRPIPHVA